MILLHKPRPDEIQRFLDEQADCDFTYEEVGRTALYPPDHYRILHTRQKLGTGAATFEAAKSLLEDWQQFQIGWLNTWPAKRVIAEGEVIAIVAQTLGFWWLNTCRIVYVIDEPVPKRRFGFACGTLPGHAGSGEERFLIEMDQDENVWYDIYSFSRPHHFLAKLGYWYMYHIQKQFGKQSAALMQERIQSVNVLPQCE